MKIWTEIAYCRNQSNKDLGYYYNEILNKYKDKVYEEDWICLLDHDARFLTDNWYKILEANITKHSNNVKLFSCRTNRVANRHQVVMSMFNEDSNTAHKKYAQLLEKQNWTEITSLAVSNAVSGVLLLFPCRPPVRFRETGKCLGIDNYFHWDILNKGFQVACIDNLYVYHWYRFDKESNNVKHLQND